jgi:putative ABC transport system ATP-binding protein
MPMPDVARLASVTKRHRGPGATVIALAAVSAQVREGEFLAVVGRAGSGKTSLLFALGGLERPDEGDLFVDGQSVWHLSSARLTEYRRSTTGWMFQEAALLPLHTALENVVLSLRLAGVDTGDAHVRAREALEAVALGPRCDQRVAELSGGEQQRIALARALAKRPRLLLADEPTSRLDSETARAMASLLRAAVRQATALVVATHDLDLASMADRQITMDSGRVTGEE